jgi:8-oxo-dGTP pyrophosphatase MutT (NUDIX family)
MGLPVPRRKHSETVGRFGFFAVEKHEIETESGASHSAYTIRARDWVAVAAITESREFVLVRQHRHGVHAFTIETAGGLVDEAEEPALAALRELKEETGYAAASIESLGVVHPNPALQDNRCFLFLARDAKLTAEIENDEEERTEAVLFSRVELLRALSHGEITHALAVLCLERALAKLGGQNT